MDAGASLARTADVFLRVVRVRRRAHARTRALRADRGRLSAGDGCETLAEEHAILFFIPSNVTERAAGEGGGIKSPSIEGHTVAVHGKARPT